MGKRWIGQVNEHALAVAQRCDPDERPDRLDVAPALPMKRPTSPSASLTLMATVHLRVQRLHLHLVRLLGERLATYSTSAR